jgi:aminopeptidase N/puromycin-sensitive aminopeptidase
VNQPGVPLVDLSIACSGGHSTLTLTSQRFFIDAAMARTAPGTPSWQIPICVKTPTSTTNACQVVNGPNATIALDGNQCVPWALVNAGAQGYFRTEYSSEVLRALAPDVATRLTEAERLSLVGDEWALVRAGRHSVGDYLTLASGFGHEHASGVLDEVAARLTFIHNYLTTDQSRAQYERVVQSLFTPLFEELGIDGAAGDDDDRRALRGTVIAMLGGAGNDLNMSATAQAALDRAMRGGTPLENTAADAIVRVAAQHGDAGLWDRLLASSKAAASPSERYRYLYALGSFQDPALIDRGLDFSLTPDLRSQDTPSFLSRYLANPAARARTWTFVKQHWDTLAPKITISLGDVRFVEGLGVFCDAGSRDDIRSFFTAHKLPAASRTLDQTLERINNCIAIKDKQSVGLRTWLAQR